MDQDTIQRLASEVASHLPNYPLWQILLAQLVLIALAVGMGAFLGEYLRTRGRNLATKADFDSLTQQLRATTETVETIRAQISQKDWARREWINLRRVKLEALLETMHDCGAYLERFQVTAFDGQILPDRDPHSAFETIGALYFPELSGNVRRYTVVYRRQIHDASVLVTELLRAGADIQARQTVFDRYSAGLNQRRTELVSAEDELRGRARELLVEV